MVAQFISVISPFRWIWNQDSGTPESSILMAQSGTHRILKSNELLKPHDRLIGTYAHKYVHSTVQYSTQAMVSYS